MGADWVESPQAVAVAVLSAALALTISLYNIVRHAANYNSPRTQKFIVRILGIVPVYAVCSCVAVAFTSVAVWVLTIRDVYEAFVVYSFLTLILEYAGGDYLCTEAIKTLPPVAHPWPFCCLPKVRRDAGLLRLCKQGTLQFVVVKPVMAVASLVALSRGVYFAKPFQSVLLVVYNLSYSTALYCLVLFFLAIKSLLTPFKPVQKFVAVKSIIFATFWQSVLVQLLPGVTSEQALHWNDFILCVEMVPFGLLLAYAFPYTEFVVAANDKAVLQSVREMLSVKDVFQDAYHSFMPSYQDYVVAREDHDAPPRTVRARTFLVGNLDAPQHRQGANASASANGRARGGGREDEKRRRDNDGGGGGGTSAIGANPSDWTDVTTLDEDWSADVTVMELQDMGGQDRHSVTPPRMRGGRNTASDDGEEEAEVDLGLGERRIPGGMARSGLAII